MRTINSVLRTLVVVLGLTTSSLVFLHGFAMPGIAATLVVATNGSDGGSCGADTAPCRSLSRAIANAANGDEIIVGPGTYGDVDDDGIFTPGVGDETPSGGAMIAVTKQLSIVSRDGAAATVIRFADGGVASVAVSLSTTGVTFGQRNRGFSVVGDNAACNIGIRSTANLSRIEGNVVTQCGRGVQATGAGVGVSYNRATANSDLGFVVQSDGAVVTHNGAVSNGGTGFVVESLKWRMTNNVATNNGSDGTTVDGNGQFTNNVMIGNKTCGLGINGFLVAGFVDLTITRNSFYGNLGNCATFNNTFTVIDARRNFWGASTGPGADPADANMGNQTLVTPALETEPRTVLGALR
jgi:hypothetical protein